MGPLILPLIGMAASMLGKQMEKKEAERLLPAQILAKSANRNGVSTLGVDALSGQQRIDNASAVDYGDAAKMLAIGMAGQGAPSEAEREELGEFQQQRQTGFRDGYNKFQRNGF